MKKLICLLLIAFQAAGCSTSGGMYKSGDSQHGELSVGRTAATVLGGLGAAAAIRKGGGGGTADAGDFCFWLFGPRPSEKIIVLPAEDFRFRSGLHQTPGQIPDTNIKCKNPLRLLQLLLF